MKKLKLVLFSLLIFHICYDGISQTKNQVEIFVAPTISSIIKNQLLFSDDNISAGLRFDIGVSYMGRIHPKARIGTGLSYSSMGYNYNYTYHDYVNGGNSEDIKSKHFANYIEVPFMFSGQIGNNAYNSFFYDIHIINQFWINTYTKSNYSEDDKINPKDISADLGDIFNVAIQIGATYQKKFDNNLFFGLGPYFKCGILKDPDIWNVGLKIAMGYHF